MPWFGARLLACAAVAIVLLCTPAQSGAEPVIGLEKTVSTTGARAGDVLTYTIHYNNTGNSTAGEVWINDTLDPSVRYQQDPATRDLSWRFTDVAPGPHSLSFRAVIDDPISNGEVISNRASLEYTNATGARVGTRTFSNGVATTVGTVITVRMTADKEKAEKGDRLLYRIEFTNHGGEPARNLWLNDTLPRGLIFVSTPDDSRMVKPISPAPGATLRWVFTQVQKGTHYVEFTARITDEASEGGTVTNNVALEYIYRDGNGHLQVERETAGTGVQIGEQDLLAAVLPYAAITLLAVFVAGMLYGFRRPLFGVTRKTAKLGAAGAKKLADGTRELMKYPDDEGTADFRGGGAPGGRKAPGQGTRATARPKERCPEPSDLDLGETYLVVEETAGESFRLFCGLVNGGRRGLCISRTHPDKLKERFGWDGVISYWLSRGPDKRILSPTQIEKIIYLIGDFLEKGGTSTVLIDGLEYLTVHNNFSRVLKFVHSLHDSISVKDSTVIIPVNPGAFSEDQMALLRRDLRVITGKDPS